MQGTKLRKKPTPKLKPMSLRMNEVGQRLNLRSRSSGIEKADIVRMATAAFLDAHPNAEDVIRAAIKYRAGLVAQ